MHTPHTFEEEAIVEPDEWMEEFEGQLALDVFQTPTSIIIKAPIAGVNQEDLEVSITDERITIQGERHDTPEESVESYLMQECYWGSFSRTYDFPITVDSDHATARLINGILTVTIPKNAKTRTRTLAVSTD